MSQIDTPSSDSRDETTLNNITGEKLDILLESKGNSEQAVNECIEAYSNLLVVQADNYIDGRKFTISSAMNHIMRTLANLRNLVEIGEISEETLERIIIKSLEKIRSYYQKKFKDPSQITIAKEYDHALVQAARRVGIVLVTKSE